MKLKNIPELPEHIQARGVWEALNPERSARKNNCAYGFYWKRDLNGENISNE